MERHGIEDRRPAASPSSLRRRDRARHTGIGERCPEPRAPFVAKSESTYSTHVLLPAVMRLFLRLALLSLPNFVGRTAMSFKFLALLLPCAPFSCSALWVMKVFWFYPFFSSFPQTRISYIDLSHRNTYYCRTIQESRTIQKSVSFPNFP